MTWLSGRPVDQGRAPSAAFLDQLAEAVHVLHRIPGPWPGVPEYQPYCVLRDPRPPARSTHPELWERAYRVVAGAPPAERAVLIHRDQSAERFLGSYRTSAGEGCLHQSYWDLRTLVDLLPDDGLAGAGLARLERYVERLLDRL